MHAVELGILVREVDAEVAATALRARERAAGDEAGNGVRRAGQAFEPGAVADESRVAPHRLAQVGRHRDRRNRGRRRVDPAWNRRLGDRGNRGAPSEDEALEHTVRGEPGGAVTTWA